MKSMIYVLCAVFLVAARAMSADQPPQPPPHEGLHESPHGPPHDPPHDPLGEAFFPPELLMQNREEIGLTDAQMESIKGELDKAHARFEELHQQLQKETEAMGALLKPDRVDEAKALAQLEKVLDLERQIKRTHLGLAVAIKNQLTPEQQAKARPIKAKWAEQMAHAKPPPQSLQEKMQKVHAGVKRWEEQSRDLSPVGELMQQFQPLMQEEKFQEAEAVLDKALAVLGKEQ